ncbi:hypothetical protein CLOP_g14738, partial [Closterium sp. NIES-67]
VATGGYD